MNTTAPTRTPVEPKQTPAVRHCLHLIARAFDVPCECGGPSSACTKDKDGNCG